MQHFNVVDQFSGKYPDKYLFRNEVSDFFERMDRDFDGRLSFGEFMGEETPLEKVFKSMDKVPHHGMMHQVFCKILIFALFIRMVMGP